MARSPINDGPSITNPFSTRFIQPGALPFLFVPSTATDAESGRESGNIGLAALAEKLQSLRAASIVGPHGAGKSTLGRALAVHFEQRNWNTQWIQLRNGEQWRPESDWAAAWSSNTLVVVDGFEQMPFWRRWWLSKHCLRRGLTLLTTSHKLLHLPLLIRVEPRLEVLQAVVGRLLRDDWSVITSEDVVTCFQRHGDARETLFELYDLFEQRTRRVPLSG